MSDLKSITDELNAEAKALIEALRVGIAREILDKVGELPEDRFLDIAAIAAQICDMPVAAVSLIDDQKAYYKGLVYDQTLDCAPRENVICNLLTRSPDQPLIIYDASMDSRVCGLPFVNGSYDYIKFYGGLPLTTKEGYSVGTICVVDRVPRRLRPDQLTALERLRRIIMSIVED